MLMYHKQILNLFAFDYCKDAYILQWVLLRDASFLFCSCQILVWLHGAWNLENKNKKPVQREKQRNEKLINSSSKNKTQNL